MKANSDKHIENLVDKIMKDVSLDTPSSNFTTNVMTQVETIVNKSTIKYQPLISKRSWFLISIAVMALISYFVFDASLESSGWFSGIDFSFVSNNKLTSSLSSFKLSKTTFYAVIMLSVMLFVQIPVLKYYFNKRLNY
jgi:hypothetical protein